VAWVDVFTRKNPKNVIVESLRYCIKEKGVNVYAYCLMTNHARLENLSKDAFNSYL